MPVTSTLAARVYPDTQRFRLDLLRTLSRIERSTRVRIRVDLNTSNVQQQLQEALRAAARQVRVPPLDTTGVRESGRQAGEEAGEEFDRSFSGTMRRTGERTGRIFATALGAVLRGTAALGAAGTAASGVTALAGAVASLSGAAAVLPGVLAAGGAAMATLRVGTAGFADALESIGDPEAFAEAIEGLAPSARAAAVALRDAAPAARALQQSVQDRLFAGFAEQITALADLYLPALTGRMTALAGQFNVAALQAARFAQAPQTFADINTIFATTTLAAGGLTAAVAPILQILRDIAAVAVGVLPGMSTGFADAATRAAEFVSAARESGQLREFISGGLEALSSLGTTLVNVGQILGSVFGAFASAGAGLLPTLESLTGEVAAFLESAEGREALDALATTLGTVADVAQEVLLTALQQLAPIVVALAPGFAEVATTVGNLLVPVLEIVGPALEAIAGFLSDNIGFIQTLAGVIGVVVAAWYAWSVAIGIVNAVLAINPFIAIAAAVIAVVALIIYNWESILNFFREYWPILLAIFTGGISALVMLIIDNWDSITQWTSEAWDAIRTFFAEWWPYLLIVFTGGLSLIVGLIIRHWDSIRSTTVGAWNAVTSFLSGVWQRIESGARERFGALVSFVSGIPGRITRAVGNLGRLLYDAGRAVISGLIDGIRSMISRLGDVASSVAGTIRDYMPFSPARRGPLSGRGYTLYSGQAIVDGLTEGILSRQGTVAAAMTSVLAGIAPSLTVATAGGDATAAPVGGNTFHIYDANPDVHVLSADLDWLARGRGV